MCVTQVGCIISTQNASRLWNILVLHLLSFLALVSHPCTKWQDLLPEAEGPRSSGLACAQQVLCFTGLSWWVAWELCYGFVMWFTWCVTCHMMKSWCVSAKCARLQHILLRLWLCFVPNLSVYTLWAWSLAKLQDHLLVLAKLAVQGSRKKLGKWDSGNYRVFLFPCPFMWVAGYSISE